MKFIYLSQALLVLLFEWRKKKQQHNDMLFMIIAIVKLIYIFKLCVVGAMNFNSVYINEFNVIT